MKQMFYMLLVLLPAFSIAQQPGGFDPAKMMERLNNPAAMQEMARQAQAAQQCMAGVDQSELQAFQKEAEAVSNEIERLCAAGKKSEALAKGMAFAKEVNSNAAVKQAQECAKGMQDMLSSMPWAQMAQMGDLDKAEAGDDDICD